MILVLAPAPDSSGSKLTVVFANESHRNISVQLFSDLPSDTLRPLKHLTFMLHEPPWKQ